MTSSDAEGRRLVCILGLDTVRDKMLHQTRFLHRHGWEVCVLTMHRDPGSRSDDPSAVITQLRPRAHQRAAQVLRHLWRHRSELHHAELYVGGRFAFVLALLCRLTRVPLLVVERGDLLLCLRKVYPRTTRASIFACYRLADRIWFKEPYMGRELAARGIRRTFLLPNAVPVGPLPEGPRDVDLLWVNRLIPERHPDWFASALAALSAERPVCTTVIGFSVGEHHAERVTALESQVRAVLERVPDTRCLPFGPPEKLYPRARFFVLPGDVSFGNFALLEAMAAGVVPVVSRTDGMDLLVQDGVNGILVEHTEQGWRDAVAAALDLPESRWRSMSAAARATVVADYSLDRWGERLLAEYRGIRPL